jgi:hypothetical protein
MKKEDLKKILKPIIQECIKEALLEEGVLSNIIKEVNKANGVKLVQEGTMQRQHSKNVKDFGSFKMDLDGFKNNEALLEQKKMQQQQRINNPPDFKKGGFAALIESANADEQTDDYGVDIREFFK